MPRRPADPTAPHVLSAASLARLPATGRAYRVADVDFPGFGVLVSPKGRVRYVLTYRVRGDRSIRRVTLGTYPKTLPDDARRLARGARAAADAGTDPAAARRARVRTARADRAAVKAARDAAKTAADAKAAQTVARIAGDYLAARGATLRDSTASLYRGLIRRYLSGDFGARPIMDVTAVDVRALLRTVADGQLPPGAVQTRKASPRTGGTGAARTLRRFLRAVWRYAADDDRPLVPDASAIPRASKLGLGEVLRERFLTPEECGRVLRALETAATVGLPPAPSRSRQTDPDAPTSKHRPKSADTPTPAHPVAVAALRFSLLSGWRKREVLTLRWDMVRRDLGLVILPETKTGESARALSPDAWAVLDTLPRVVGSPYVFPSSRDARRPWGDVGRLWDAVRHAAGVGGARFHDLRHTAASLAINAGATLPEVQAMLGHASARATERYAKLFPKTGEAAAAKVAAALADAAKTPAPVVRPLRQGRA